MSASLAPARRYTAGSILRRALTRHKLRLGVGIFGLCGHQVCEATVPVAIGLIIDRAVATGSGRNLLIGIVGLIVLFFVLTFAWRLGARVSFTALQRENHELRVEVAEHVLDPRGARTGRQSGELLSIATADAMRAASILRYVPGFAAGMAALIYSAIVLLRIDVPLGLGVLLGAPAIVGLLQLLGPRLTRRNVTQQQATGLTTALATDLVRGARALRGVGAEGSAVARYRRSSQATLDATVDAATTGSIYQGTTMALSGVFLAVVAGFAGWIALHGGISVGELITVVGLAQFVAEPVQTLGFTGQMIAISRSSAARVADVFNAEPVVAGGDREVSGTGDIELRDISYRGLDHLDLTVRPGELLGVVAVEPAEADALLDLLADRVPADGYTGQVLVDGVPLPEVSIASLRHRLLVETHNVALFAGTVRTNVLAGVGGDGSSGTGGNAGSSGHGRADGRPAAAVLPDVLAASAADDVVAAHPDGLERVLTDRGTSLSGGERQRLGLARALLADRRTPVLHDPTTAVDAVTEEGIAAGLARLRHDRIRAPGSRPAPVRSTVVVTSSPAILAQASRVVLLADGRVADEGTHEELAGRRPDYREQVLR